MQIDRLTHLQFPPDRRLQTDTDDATAAGTAAPAQRHAVEVLSAVSERRDSPLPSALLRLGSDAPTPALYAPGRKNGPSANDDADWDAMAQRHEQAVARQGQDVRNLGLDKDGILVAKPRTAFSAQESDFVALAVSAMRDFQDSADRAKSAEPGEASAQAQAGSGLRNGLAHLAARFKAFA